MARRRPTLAEVAVMNLRSAGLGQARALVVASQALGDVWALAYCAHRLGHWPTQAEYANYWRIDERTAGRHWARFRRAFPGEDSPDRLARWLLSEASSRIEESASAMSVLAPDGLVAA